MSKSQPLHFGINYLRVSNTTLQTILFSVSEFLIYSNTCIDPLTLPEPIPPHTLLPDLLSKDLKGKGRGESEDPSRQICEN